jgi:hypothetical protein
VTRDGLLPVGENTLSRRPPNWQQATRSTRPPHYEFWQLIEGCHLLLTGSDGTQVAWENCGISLSRNRPVNKIGSK